MYALAWLVPKIRCESCAPAGAAVHVPSAWRAITARWMLARPGDFFTGGGQGGGQAQGRRQIVGAGQLPQRLFDEHIKADKAGYGVARQAEIPRFAQAAEYEGFARLHGDFVMVDGADAFDGGAQEVVIADGNAARAGDDVGGFCRPRPAVARCRPACRRRVLSR